MSAHTRRGCGAALPFFGTLRVGGSVDQLLTAIRALEINVEDSNCVRADLSGDVGATKTVLFRSFVLRSLSRWKLLINQDGGPLLLYLPSFAASNAFRIASSSPF